MEDILDDPKLEQCSPDEFRFFFRLLAMLNRTKSRDGEIELTHAALRLLSGREQLRAAVAVWRRGNEAGLWRIRAEGPRNFTCVPKWPKVQELAPKLPPKAPEEIPPPTPTPTPTPTPIIPDGDSDPPDPTSEPVEEKPKRKRKPPPEWARDAAILLASRVADWLPGAKVPTTEPGVEKWAREIAKIQAEPSSVIGAIEWLYGKDNEGDFRIEVQSGRSLREKWGKIVAAAKRVEGRRNGSNGKGGRHDRIATAVREFKERDRAKAGLESSDDEHDRSAGSEGRAPGGDDRLGF